VWGCILPVLRQEDLKFKANLRPCQTKRKEKTKNIPELTRVTKTLQKAKGNCFMNDHIH
jgi:hypothetical protein